MTSNAKVPADKTSDTKSGGVKSARLYYLDWLRVILIFGVFLYHVVRPFDPLTNWQIDNAEQSDTILTFLLLVNPWGIGDTGLLPGCRCCQYVRPASAFSVQKADI